LDEAHYAKTSDSGRTRALFGDGGIASRASHVLAPQAHPSQIDPPSCSP
jgi:hypothetical protein